MNANLPPIRRSVSVAWDQAAAFRRFTADFATWWPRSTHSIGGARVARIVLETHVGGLIYEEHVDGRRFQWGQILEWEAPVRLRFTWHPSREPATAQEVEVRFVPEGAGTRVELVSEKWENWGEKAERAHRAYNLGWGYVLNVWAGRRTAGMALLDGIVVVVKALNRLRGRRPEAIDTAGGELPRAQA
jgi:hypothetical protein